MNVGCVCFSKSLSWLEGSYIVIFFLIYFSLTGPCTPWSMKLFLYTVDSVHLEQHLLGKQESISLLTPHPQCYMQFQVHVRSRCIIMIDRMDR